MQSVSRFFCAGLLLCLPVVACAQQVDLMQVFSAALESSPRLNIARYQRDIGAAQQQQAMGRLLPQLNLYANFSDNRNYTERTSNQVVDGVVTPVTEDIRTDYDGEKYTLQLRQVIFDWQAFSAKRRADDLLGQKEAEYYAELNALLVDVSEKYLDVLEAQDLLTTVTSERKAIERQLKQVETLYKRQLAKITDLYEVQARAASVIADEIDAVNGVALAKEALWEVSGLQVDSLSGLNPKAIFPPLEGTIDTWVDKARLANPQVLARKRASEAAGKRVSERRGSYLPNVSFVAQRQRSDIGYENSEAPLSETTYLGVDVTMPLFAGGSNRASVREALAQEHITRYEHQLTLREVLRRTRTAYLNVQSSVRRTEATRKLQASTAKASKAMSKSFEYGTVTIVDVLNALRDEFSAKRELQQARYGHIKALLNLKREAGEVSAEDLVMINQWLLPVEPRA